jgi:hypothetical protein
MLNRGKTSPFYQFLTPLILFLSAFVAMAAKGIDPVANNWVRSTPPPDTVHGLIGSYYNGVQFDQFVATRIDSVIQFDWGGSGIPIAGLGHNNFSVRWVGYVKAPVTGTYTFHTRSDDGARLIINGLVILDYWGACCRDFTGTVFMEAGKLYPMVFEMHQGGGGAAANYVDWEAPGLSRELVPNEDLYAIAPPAALPRPDVTRDTTNGLIGYYYSDPTSNPKWFDTLVATRIDPQMNFDWGSGSPMPGRLPVDYFSVRWVGFIKAPVTGTYTFHTWTDDGSRLTVAGKKIIDYWGSCCSDHAGTIDLNAGVLYPIVLEFHEIGGGAGSHYINWEAPGLPLENIPISDYYTVKLQTVFQPTVTPAPAIYVDSVKVTLNTLTSGADIHYTLDGSTPDENSPLYTAPVLITKNETINAVAFHHGMVSSVMTSAFYRIIPPPVSNPTFYPGQGIYSNPIKVSINTKDAGATIYYTLDGSNPDSTSPVYSGPVEIDSTARLKSYAVKAGMSPSSVSSATYTILPPGVSAPVFSVAGGSYDNAQVVTITSATAGATIHYATNDNVLNEASPVYSEPVTISKTTTLKAYAEKAGIRTSDVTIAIYKIGNQQLAVDTPRFSMPGGHYSAIQQIAITTKTSGATIYYTTDGSIPNDSSNEFIGPILINDSVVLKAYAVKGGMTPSTIISATYVVNASALDTGIINDKLPTPQLKISPNPAADQARISWTNMIYTLDGAYITVTDSRGVITAKVNIKGGYTYYILNTSTYANGVYFIRVVSGSSTLLGKLIIGR